MFLGGDSGTQKGLKIRRYFTRAGVDPYDEIEWEQRAASIINEKGKVVFEQNNVRDSKDVVSDGDQRGGFEVLPWAAGKSAKRTQRAPDDRTRGRHDHGLGPQGRLFC